jgi:hypothetical protein
MLGFVSSNETFCGPFEILANISALLICPASFAVVQWTAISLPDLYQTGHIIPAFLGG